MAIKNKVKKESLNIISPLRDFILFFQGIPAKKFCINYFRNDAGQCCARGHVGEYTGADYRLLKLAPAIAEANNGCAFNKTKRAQNPDAGIKKRVLSYLRELAQ